MVVIYDECILRRAKEAFTVIRKIGDFGSMVLATHQINERFAERIRKCVRRGGRWKGDEVSCADFHGFVVHAQLTPAFEDVEKFFFRGVAVVDERFPAGWQATFADPKALHAGCSA